jgi:superfamily II DNA or RNA helicase
MNAQKGLEYEIFIKGYLNKAEGDIAWLWSDIPEAELRKCTILGDWNEYRFNRKMLKKENCMIDTGCDILLKSNNKYYIIQCKNYDIKNYITIKDLAGFFMMTKLYNLDGIVYYTSKLSPNLYCQRKCPEIQFIKNNFEIETELEIQSKKETEYDDIISLAYDYQNDAYNVIKNVFLENKRAILQLPCGMGKTLISMKVGLDYDTVVIISPLKQYCIQNLERFKSEVLYKDYESLIIDSDGTRNITEISKFIKNNKKIILSVCYKSCDILMKVLNKLKNYIVIVDEFHNITKNDILMDTEIHQLLVSNSKILFMSATPRIFYLDDDDEEYDLYEEIFGKIVYKYNMGDAIKNKRICDYQIYVPDIKLNNEIFIQDMSSEIDITKFDNDIVKKCNYLLRGLLETGGRKCIIYVKTHSEADIFKNTFKQLNEYFSLDLHVDTILSMDSKSSREDKLKLFIGFNGIALLINVFILNECIDIKECDSIFITYPSESKISNIQRLCRANRIDKDNIHKIAKIFLWCDEYQHDLVDIISHVKEFDNTFSIDKVNILKISNTQDLIVERSKNLEEYKVLDGFIINVKLAYSWMGKFYMLQKYITENKTIPSIGDTNIENKRLSGWFQNQKKNFRKKIKMMKYEKYYNLWKTFMETHQKQFFTEEEKWSLKLNKLKEFIDANNKTPSKYAKPDEDDDENEFSEEKLGSWLDTQKKNCKNEIKMFRFTTTDGNKIYEHPEIVNLWNTFIDQYKKYLLQGNEHWYSRLNELKIFLDENRDKKQKTPSSHSKDEKVKSLASFIGTQKKNYLNKTQIMQDPEIYDTWTKFIEEYADSMMSENEFWLKRLNELKSFMKLRNKRPNKNSNDVDEKKLGEFITKELGNYKNSRGVMNKYDNLRQEFELFLNEFDL